MLSYAYNPRFTFTTTFGYSGTQQMTYGYGVAYNYDPSGNVDLNGAVTGPNNLVYQDVTNSYTYDSEGNLIKKVNKSTNETTTYTYDQFNHLLTATDSTYTVLASVPTYTKVWATTYTYDGLGRMVASQSWSTTITASSNHYLYNGSTLVADLDTSNNVQVRYAYAPNGDLAARLEANNGRVLWYIDDNTGTVLDVVDSGGDALLRLKNGGYNIADSWSASTTMSYGGYVYDLDGTWQPSSWSGYSPAVNNRFQLAGKSLDKVANLYYQGGVFYDPFTGRTLSEQVGGLTGGNLYMYQQDNPANWGPSMIDPNAAQGGLGLSSLLADENELAAQAAATRQTVVSFGAGLADAAGDEVANRQNRQIAGTEQYVDYNSGAYLGTRYIKENLSNWASRAWGEFNYKPAQALTNAVAGFEDAITAGLTKHLRDWGLDMGLTPAAGDVDESSAMYEGASYAGQGLNLAITAATVLVPGLGEMAVVGEALEALNAVQAAGMAASGIDAFERGDLQGTMDAIAGLGGVLLRGVSPCGWASDIAEVGHRAFWRTT